MKRTANAGQPFWGRGLCLSVVLMIGLMLAVNSTANAQAMLGARNSATQALRMKALDVNVSIRGAFAQTQVQMVFQNELSERTEADFEYVVPDGSVVTHFAYWFKDEKVVARVVEKERALAIYQAITVQQRDPALIERISKNKFRARIFPIEPNADLKVEMRWVQVLSSDAKGIFYKFPLKPQEEGKGTLENLSLRVKAIPDAGVTKVVNNYKLTPKTEEKAQVLHLTEKNYRPSQDLLVRFERPARALHTSLFAAPSGGRDGFFALALTPSQNLKAPKLSLDGIATYSVLPARLPNLRAHQTFVVVGRYRPNAGNKPASIALSGFGANTARQTLSFSGQREDNNLASKLWAAVQIEELSPNQKTAERNRERLIALSTRFTLPSSVTSWLAVPKEEWQNFKQQIAWSDIERIGPQLYRLKKQGKLRTPGAKRLRSQFYKACYTLGENPAERLAEYLEVEERERRAALEGALYQESYRMARRLAEAVASGKNAEAARYRRRIGQINRQLKQSPQQGIADANNQLLYKTITDWVEIKLQPTVDEKRVLRLENRLRRLQPNAKARTQQIQRDIGKSKLNQILYTDAKQVVEEITAGRANSEKVKEFERKAAELGTRVGVNGPDILREQTRYEARQRANYFASQHAEEQNEYKPNQEKIGELETQLARLESVGVNKDDLLQQTQTNWAMNSWSFGYKWAVAQHGENPDPAVAAHWRQKLETAVRLNNNLPHNRDNGSQQTVDEVLANIEFHFFNDRVNELRNQRRTEASLKNQDPQELQRIDSEIEEILNSMTPQARQQIMTGQGWITMYSMRDLMIAEYKKPQPNPLRTAEIEQKFINSQHDHYFTRSKIEDPKIYGQLRVERLKARTQQELLAEKLQNEDATLSPAEKQRLSANQAQLAKREKELAVRMGDPLIQVQAPQDAQQVVAVFPGGEIKQMVFNTDSKQWEARFDVPTYAVEGAYTVSVIVVFKDGTRKHLTMRFHVDVTAPGGAGKVLLINKNGAKLLRLELDADEDTARVLALLPNGQKVELSPSTQQENRFFALAPLTGKGQRALELKSLNVVFILTDRAHNRTTVTVDMSR